MAASLLLADPFLLRPLTPSSSTLGCPKDPAPGGLRLPLRGGGRLRGASPARGRLALSFPPVVLPSSGDAGGDASPGNDSWSLPRSPTGHNRVSVAVVTHRSLRLPSSVLVTLRRGCRRGNVRRTLSFFAFFGVARALSSTSARRELRRSFQEV
eukprot:GHVU01219026.1.p1 GENE.GHVU01219026.1~~GHVU01219026.1.p1  ORF type:complete len:164 (-),score=3.08 GHVU01219026.1:84-545(-)